jgi:hypothetical protein
VVQEILLKVDLAVLVLQLQLMQLQQQELVVEEEVYIVVQLLEQADLAVVETEAEEVLVDLMLYQEQLILAAEVVVLKDVLQVDAVEMAAQA